MNTINYIPIHEFKDRLESVIDDVLKNDAEYYIMINNEPKIRIGPVIDKDGKKVVAIEEEKEKLGKYVK